MTTMQELQTRQAIRAGIISRLRLAHGAIHYNEFSAEQQAELESLASLNLIMKLPRQMYTVIQPGKGKRR